MPLIYLSCLKRTLQHGVEWLGQITRGRKPQKYWQFPTQAGQAAGCCLKPASSKTMSANWLRRGRAPGARAMERELEGYPGILACWLQAGHNAANGRGGLVSCKTHLCHLRGCLHLLPAGFISGFCSQELPVLDIHSHKGEEQKRSTGVANSQQCLHQALVMLLKLPGCCTPHSWENRVRSGVGLGWLCSVGCG